MKTFKARHSPSYYKSPQYYLKAVYRANKAEIDQAFASSFGSGWRGFRTAVESKMMQSNTYGIQGKRKGLRAVSSAVGSVSRSNLFMTKEERYRQYIVEGFRSNSKAWKAFREATKVRGRYSKVDYSRIAYRDGVYRYDVQPGKNGEVWIEFKPSPERIVIYKKDPDGVVGRSVYYAEE